MFKIPKQEKESVLIDLCIKSMQEYAQKQREEISQRYAKSVSTKSKSPDEIRLNKRKDLELQKLSYLNYRVNTQLKKIIKSFPRFEKVSTIYLKLVDASPNPVKQIQDSLARLLWIINSIESLTENSSYKIKKARSQQTIDFIMKKHLGKVNSLYNKNKSFFKLLRDSTEYLNKLPTLETEIFTVSISGFPNVGKSTLMKKITKSKVEIQNYPFTTKGLMLGYIKNDKTKIVQLIDTPGLLGRDKNNLIEQKAQIILTDFCDLIVFVFDLTESCGYSLENQMKLFKKTSLLGKDVFIYLSKKDLFDKEELERLDEIKLKYKKYQIFDDFEKLTTILLEKQKNSKKSLDLSKLKVIK